MKLLKPTRAIGHGAFGTVYEALAEDGDGRQRRVALKVLAARLGGLDALLHQIADCAPRLRRVQHPSVVKIHQVARVGGRWTEGLGKMGTRWAIVMDLAEGANLRELRQHCRVPTAVALAIVGEVASALHAAWHSEGHDGHPLRMLHRDVKPANVMLGQAGQVQLLDLGTADAELACLEEDTLTLRQDALEFLAPERLRLVDGPEGDVYGLGLLLYELLARRPFGKTSFERDIHEDKLTAAIAHLVPMLGSKEEQIRALLADTLAHDPTARPRAEEVAAICKELSGSTTALLQDWAETAVPKARSNRAPPPLDHFAGSTLVLHRALTGTSSVDALVAEEQKRREAKDRAWRRDEEHLAPPRRTSSASTNLQHPPKNAPTRPSPEPTRLERRGPASPSKAEQPGPERELTATRHRLSLPRIPEAALPWLMVLALVALGFMALVLGIRYAP